MIDQETINELKQLLNSVNQSYFKRRAYIRLTRLTGKNRSLNLNDCVYLFIVNNGASAVNIRTSAGEEELPAGQTFVLASNFFPLEDTLTIYPTPPAVDFDCRLRIIQLHEFKE